MSYDEEYVKALREENAKWRTKLRDLEGQQLYKDVEVEFAKRGISADPTWVSIEEGQTVEQAVDALVAKHPNLSTAPKIQSTEPNVDPGVVARRPLAPNAMQPQVINTEAPGNPFHQRSMEEIKKDPVARAKLRDMYRALLAQSSNQPHYD